MYHSITFGDKNTWDDWRLVPSSRPVFNPPTVKTKYIDIPGADGKIDLSDSLSGYPVYNNREGSFEFVVLNGFKEWHTAYSDIADYLHGKKMRAVLEDDPEYFYEGRFSVDEWNSSEPPRSTITISYDVGPYKWTPDTTLDDWKWDPFNFNTGIIFPMLFKDITVSSASEWTTKTYKVDDYGRAPLCPVFIISTSNRSGMDINFINPVLNLNITRHYADGRQQDPELVFYGGTVTVKFKGVGKVSIEFRKGRL